MLTAIEGGRPDHVPLSFMIFQALGALGGVRDFVERSLDLGMDPVVSLAAAAPSDGRSTPTPREPRSRSLRVTVRECANDPGARYPAPQGIPHRLGNLSVACTAPTTGPTATTSRS